MALRCIVFNFRFVLEILINFLMENCNKKNGEKCSSFFFDLFKRNQGQSQIYVRVQLALPRVQQQLGPLKIYNRKTREEFWWKEDEEDHVENSQVA